MNTLPALRPPLAQVGEVIHDGCHIPLLDASDVSADSADLLAEEIARLDLFGNTVAVRGWLSASDDDWDFDGDGVHLRAEGMARDDDDRVCLVFGFWREVA